MSQYRASKASATAAVDWHDLKASGEILENVNSGVLVVRTSQASRVAPGVTDPGVSTSAGVASVADEAVTVMLTANAAEQSIWVQTPADQSTVFIEVDEVVSGPLAVVIA